MRVYRPTYGKAGDIKESSTLACEFRDHTNTRRHLGLFEDQKASETTAALLDRLIDLRRADQPPDKTIQTWLSSAPDRIIVKLAEWGLIADSRAEASKSIEEHLIAWGAYLRRERGTSEQQIRQCVNRARRVLVGPPDTRTSGQKPVIVAGCGFRNVKDIEPERVAEVLEEMRTTPMVRPTTEKEQTEINAQTSNHYLTACKGFCKWLVKKKKHPGPNPLESLSSLSKKAVESDPRHKRCGISEEDAVRLISVTYSQPERFGMTGPERALLYRLAMEIGLREGDFSALIVNNLDLENNPPVVWLAGGLDKNGEGFDLPIRPETAALLRAHVSDRLPAAKVFNLPRLDLVVDMLREDMAPAGIPNQDASGRYFDFHCLRGLAATFMLNNGANPRLVQQILRHKDIRTTMRYARATALKTRAEALDHLPCLNVTSQAKVREGTTGALVANAQSANNKIRHKKEIKK